MARFQTWSVGRPSFRRLPVQPWSSWLGIKYGQGRTGARQTVCSAPRAPHWHPKAKCAPRAPRPRAPPGLAALPCQMGELGQWPPLALLLCNWFQVGLGRSETPPPVYIWTTWHKRVQTCLYHITVCTSYILCYSTYMVQTCTSWKISRHWCTCMYMLIIFWKHINMSVHDTYMVCTIRAMNMYVHCLDVYVHVYTCTYTIWII
jgi:hypothetical protein